MRKGKICPNFADLSFKIKVRDVPIISSNMVIPKHCILVCTLFNTEYNKSYIKSIIL